MFASDKGLCNTEPFTLMLCKQYTWYLCGDESAVITSSHNMISTRLRRTLVFVTLALIFHHSFDSDLVLTGIIEIAPPGCQLHEHTHFPLPPQGRLTRLPIEATSDTLHLCGAFIHEILTQTNVLLCYKIRGVSTFRSSLESLPQTVWTLSPAAAVGWTSSGSQWLLGRAGLRTWRPLCWSAWSRTASARRSWSHTHKYICFFIFVRAFSDFH